MRPRARRIVALSLYQQSLLVVELAPADSGHKLVKSAQFEYPQGLSLETPVELGKAFGKSISQARLGTQDVVIGLPARWLITRRKELPPAPAGAAASSLRLYAETEFSSELKDLAIDYAGQASPSAASEVMVVATNRTYVDACVAFAKAAGLRLKAITSTGVALAWLGRTDTGNQDLVVGLMPSGAELVVQRRGIPMQLRHVAFSNGASREPASLVNELRRTIAGLPQPAAKLTVCGDSELAPDLPRAIADRLGLPADPPRVSAIQIGSEADTQRYAPAIAVGLTQLVDMPGTVDFLHSRLAPPLAKTNRRPMLWAGLAGLALLLVAIGAFYDLQRRQTAVASMRSSLAAQELELKKARASVARLAIANQWTNSHPRYLACLAAITALFPDEGSIWATSLSLRQDMTGQLAGKASSQQQVLQLLDKLKDHKQFVDPKLLELREDNSNPRGGNAGGAGGAGGAGTSFTITFTFKAPE